MKPWKLLEVKYSYDRENPYDVAVLPIGATEPHNLHLPYGNDALTTERIGDLICERAHSLGAKVALLPCIPFGVDSNLMGFPMTISLNPSTLDTIVCDVTESVEAHDIRKLVILNGHGGNGLKNILRELYGKTSVFLSLVDWYKVASDICSETIVHPGDHADEMETSVSLHLFPELTDLSLADDGQIRSSRFEAIDRGWAQITRPWDILTTNAGVGNPHEATAEKGKRIVETVVERIGTYIKELSESEMDEQFPY